MGRRQGNSAESGSKLLTRRQGEILALLAQGYSGPEIAEKLALAISSVRSHLLQIYAKLGVNSKRQALTRAAALGLLRAPITAVGASPGAHPPTLATLPVTDSFSAIQPVGSRPAGADTFPPARAQVWPPNNLPLQLTQFFGREHEIALLTDCLARQRLVTLTGSGGVGKTRLSLQISEKVLGDFADGVWFVELAPLSNPELVAQTVAKSVGLRDEAGRPILESLSDFLRSRQALLVLDNCEHLLEASTCLADTLLHACPRLKLLVSSREPTSVAGEVVFAVPSLHFPEADQVFSPERLGEYASVRMFVDRARLVLPGYQLDTRNAKHVAHICQRLEGIPLALELAAARMNLLTAQQLAGRLDDVLRVLTGGRRTALPRQQALRATIDWSYNLLNEEERLLLQRLSVFAGGCALEAAEAVCSGDSLEIGSVLEVLASLVAKSMVIAERHQGQETRYRMLEMVRQYAREKLREAGDSNRLHTRHRDYFLQLTETFASIPDEEERRIRHRKLQADQDNLRAALEWSFNDLLDIEAAPRLVVAIPWPWRYQETVDWFKRAVAWCERHKAIPDRILAKLLQCASPPIGQDDVPTSLAWARQSVEVSRRLGPEDRETLMWCLFNLGNILRFLDQEEEALPPFAEAEAILESLALEPNAPSQRLRDRALFAAKKAEFANRCGRYQDAKRFAGESIRLLTEAGSPSFATFSWLEIGIACVNLAEYDPARDHLWHALSMTEIGADSNYMRLNIAALIRRWLAVIDLRQGNLDSARDYCHSSIRHANQIPDYNIIASGLGLLAAISARQGQRARATRLAGASAAMYARQKYKPWEDSSLDTLLPGWRDGPEQAGIQRAYTTGQSMQAEEAVAFALSDESN